MPIDKQTTAAQRVRDGTYPEGASIKQDFWFKTAIWKISRRETFCSGGQVLVQERILVRRHL